MTRSPRDERRLERLLNELADELLQASDEEVGEVCSDIGIDPQMKGSIAWSGVLFPAKMRLTDWFDLITPQAKGPEALSPPEGEA